MTLYELFEGVVAMILFAMIVALMCALAAAIMVGIIKTCITGWEVLKNFIFSKNPI